MTIRHIFLFIVILASSIFPISLLADKVFPDAETAIAQIDKQRSQQLASQLQQSLQNKPADEAVRILQLFISKEKQTSLETEYALWQLALSGRTQAGDLIDQEVLTYLVSYDSRSRIQHPENIDGSLPLFNIRAAATGALSLRQRQQDLEVARGLEQQPANLLSHYLQSPSLSQAALRQAAVDLPATVRTQLLTISLSELQSPQTNKAVKLALIDLSADLAFTSTDANALSAIIATGEGTRLPRLLIQLNNILPAEKSKALLYQATKLNPHIAAIAIGELSKTASFDAEVYEQLLSWLNDPELGSAAALALSSSKHQNLSSELQQLSNSKLVTTANNAKLALLLLEENQREQAQ